MYIYIYIYIYIIIYNALKDLIDYLFPLTLLTDLSASCSYTVATVYKTILTTGHNMQLQTLPHHYRFTETSYY